MVQYWLVEFPGQGKKGSCRAVGACAIFVPRGERDSDMAFFPKILLKCIVEDHVQVDKLGVPGIILSVTEKGN